MFEVWYMALSGTDCALLADWGLNSNSKRDVEYVVSEVAMRGYICAWSSGDGGPVELTEEPDEPRLWYRASWKFFGSADKYPP